MTVPTAARTSRIPSARHALARRCRTLTEARWFALVVIALILGNAVLLGVETYAGVVHDWHHWLRFAEHCCIAGFAVEILLRIGAHADRPKDFFRDPWNLFDLAVVLCVFLPVVSENTTLLRLLRLARVLRTARFLPQLRILLVAIGRSLPGTVSFLLVGALLLYVYAMIGWIFFARADPEHFGSLGRAVLTLLLLMTLDGLGEAVHGGLEISRWSIVYYGVYVLMASFVLVNVLIGVVINSLEEARELEKAERERAEREKAERAERRGSGGVAPQGNDPAPLLHQRIAAARQALDDLERSLPREVVRVPGVPGAPAQTPTQTPERTRS
ncbi:ion transporter [Streptomyces monticola]|uniref:Ion transporter n=1 Tax=Streptomyces monticola TaxID=2666263 RepID=A0ABW2JT75_9ACTN